MKGLKSVLKASGCLAALSILLVVAGPVYAGQYESLSPLLMDLKG